MVGQDAYGWSGCLWLVRVCVCVIGEDEWVLKRLFEVGMTRVRGRMLQVQPTGREINEREDWCGRERVRDVNTL